MLLRTVGRNIFTRASSTASMECKALALSMPEPYILHVEINRPKKLNSMNSDFWTECRDVFESAAADEKVRAIVCSGAGEKVFSAGLDLAELAGGLGDIMAIDDIGRKAILVKRMINRLQQSFNAIAGTFCSCVFFIST